MSNIFDLMPEDSERFLSGHTIPLAEAAGELEAAIQLSLRGFYRQAFATLRVVLELGVFSVQLDTFDQSHEEITPWLAGGFTPHFKVMLARLKRLPNFAAFFAHFDIQRDLQQQYEHLNGFVHIRGPQHTAMALNQANVRIFSKEAFHTTADHINTCVRYIVALHVLKYPIALQETPLDEKFGLNGPVGGFLNPHQAEQLREFVGELWAAALQSISDSDEGAVETARGIRALPDITDDELEQQMIEQDKYMITQQGFERWTSLHDGLYTDEETQEIWTKRQALLQVWAAENGLLDENGAQKYRDRLAADLLKKIKTRD